MKKRKKITVYSGESISDKCEKELHPVAYVKLAEKLVLSNQDEVAYSNNPDFVSAVKYLGEKYDITTVFYLDSVCYDDDIEPLFKDFNRSLDLIEEIVSSKNNELIKNKKQ